MTRGGGEEINTSWTAHFTFLNGEPQGPVSPRLPVNYMRLWLLHLFQVLSMDMESEHETLLFHTNLRWLPNGKMLRRLYELREEVAIFLDSHQKTGLHDKFQSERIQITLAYLENIFEVLNNVNLKLQGKNINIIRHHDTFQDFMAKLDL